MPHQAKAIAVLGTGSDVGKSLITAGLCRLLARSGVAVVPFKAQNMSLNSFVTPEGGEIGRAQALQSEACGIQPHVDMNPILLKPESDLRCQVIVQGKVLTSLDAKAYLERTHHPDLARAVRESYHRLASRYEMVVIEGAGSAAEMNLCDRDLVNWPVVEMADARVILVGDIDRGGVFAQVIGTLDLIAPQERARVCGVVINKFRGDASLFADGVRVIQEQTGVPVLGVLPYMGDLSLDQEDSLTPQPERRIPFSADRVNIAVILLPHMSNFTDFNSLAEECDVRLRYAAVPDDVLGADVIVLPGTKTTQRDLADLRARGFESVLREHVRRGGELVGICGGYQMLGQRIADPDGVEGGGATTGLGFLDVSTVLTREKITYQVEAQPLETDDRPLPMVRGYLVHVGRTDRGLLQPTFRLCPTGVDNDEWDGARREDGLVWGTYIHGLFDRSGYRRAWLNRLRLRKGLPSAEPALSTQVDQKRLGALDRWADHLKHHLDLIRVWQILGVSAKL